MAPTWQRRARCKRPSIISLPKARRAHRAQPVGQGFQRSSASRKRYDLQTTAPAVMRSWGRRLRQRTMQARTADFQCSQTGCGSSGRSEHRAERISGHFEVLSETRDDDAQAWGLVVAGPRIRDGAVQQVIATRDLFASLKVPNCGTWLHGVACSLTPRRAQGARCASISRSWQARSVHVWCHGRGGGIASTARACCTGRCDVR